MGNLGEHIKPCSACGYDFKYEESKDVFCDDCLSDYYVEQMKEQESGS